MPRNFIRSLVAAAVLIGAPITNAAPVLMDGFETANLSAPQGPLPAVNENGFSWDGTNWTQVVGTINGQPTAVYGARGVISDIWSGRDFTCKTGTYCLRFRFVAGNNMAEQRFSLGRHYSDVWFGYWIRVPTNFRQGIWNNKFAAFWTNEYDGPGDVTWQTRPTSGGSAKLVVQDGGVAQPEIDAGNNFIKVPDDRGRWMQVAIRMKPATSSGASNGVIQFYRRWSNESNYTLLYSKTNARFYEGGNGIHQGYLMGWVGDPYTEDTDWLLDDFTVSESSLVAVQPDPATPSPPAAPVLQVTPL